MRNLWTQREIVDMGKWLGFKAFDRRHIRHWIKQGVFPEPVASVQGVISLYKDSDQLDAGFIDIGRRMREPVEVDYEDVEMAKRAIMEKNKAENIDQLFNVIKGNNGDK